VYPSIDASGDENIFCTQQLITACIIFNKLLMAPTTPHYLSLHPLKFSDIVKHTFALL